MSEHDQGTTAAAVAPDGADVLQETHDLKAWLESMKLEQYYDAFVGAGYATTADLEGIDSDRLEGLGVALPGHRNRILHRLPGNETAESELPVQAAADDFGLNGLLDDINGMLGDLGSHEAEAEQQASQQAAADDEASSSALSSRSFRPVSMMLSEKLGKVNDERLDSLLEDLCNFGTGTADRPRVRYTTMQPGVAPPAAGQAAEGTGQGEGSNGKNQYTDVAVPGNSQIAAQGSDEGKERKTKMTETDLTKHFEVYRERLSTQAQLSPDELSHMMKEEKVRLALERLASAQLTTFVVPVYTPDGTCKTVCIDNTETAYEVCNKLVIKNMMAEHPFWQILEHDEDLNLQRGLEDHESVGVAFNAWPATSENRLELIEARRKYNLFVNPEDYFPPYLKDELVQSSGKNPRTDQAKRILFQEYLATMSRVPDIKGYLYERSTSKKWKKRFCVLRASGIYYSTKMESEASRDLVCLVKFDDHNIFLCKAPESDYKSPNMFAIAFKPDRRKQVIKPQELVLVCANSEEDHRAWLAGCRLAKYGNQLRQSYQDITQRYDKLVEMGLFGAEVKRNLVNTHLQNRQKRQTDRNAVARWMSQRGAINNPGVSAETGVEFDLEVEAYRQQDLVNKWYHGAMSRRDAEELIRQRGMRPGTFLVRDSSKSPGSLVLSVCYGYNIHHHHITVNEDGKGRVSFHLADGPGYPSLHDLIDHYQNEPSRLPKRLGLGISRP